MWEVEKTVGTDRRDRVVAVVDRDSDVALIVTTGNNDTASRMKVAKVVAEFLNKASIVMTTPFPVGLEFKDRSVLA